MVLLTEIGRRAGVATATAERRLARAGVEPDAELLAGALREPSPLFFEDRLPDLLAHVAGSNGPSAICGS